MDIDSNCPHLLFGETTSHLTSDSEQCSNRLQLDLMLILDNFLCELNSHILYDPSD